MPRDEALVVVRGRRGYLARMWSVRIAALLVLLSGAAAAEELRGSPRIIDADTLAFGDVHVRLNGIDAPEKRQICQDQAGAAYHCGLTAAARLTGELAGAQVRCSGTDYDRYQRLIATCWKGTEDLNRWLVSHGWAVAYRRYSTAYVDAEDEARMAKRGLWAGDFEMPWDWRRAH